MEANQIAGRWRIVSWHQVYDDGRRVYPFGQALDGFIEYGVGRMFCVFSKRERTRFTTGGQWDSTDAEKARAYGEYLTYAGGYTFDGTTVTHEIELCIFPNWQGTVQQRQVIFGDDDTLTLVARIESGTPEARTASLVWRRDCPPSDTAEPHISTGRSL
jgi:hypothetical protein